MGTDAHQRHPGPNQPRTLELRAPTVDQEYYVAIEAFDENGVSKPSAAVHLP